MLGQTVGAYRIVKQLGEGAMGVVYLAEHATLGHKVAMKVLKPDFCKGPDGNVNEQTLRGAMKRFFNEAQIASNVEHAGIVKVTDFGEAPGGRPYYVMEFLRGQSLASRLQTGGRLPMGQAVRLGKQIARALGAAHEHGIVHRDLKPDNIFVVPDPEVPGGERIKILDFGIAKLKSGTFQGSLKTHVGAQMGTPYYMSPEQWKDAASADARSDIYALGCVVFEMVCGRPPFVRETLHELLYCHLTEQPPRPSSIVSGLPAAFDDAILRSLAKDPAQRLQTTVDFIAALETCGDPSQPRMVAATLVADVGDVARSDKRPVRSGTTLGESAGQVEEKAETQPKRRMVVVASGITLAALAAIGFVVFRPGQQTDKAAGDTAAVTPPPAIVDAAAAPAPPPQPRSASIKLANMPDDADVLVWLDGQRVFTNPIELPISKQQHELRVEAEGYSPRTLRFVPSESQTLDAHLDKPKPVVKKHEEPRKEAPAIGGADTADADALAQQALEAYVKGQYALAMELANKSLRINKRQALAIRIVGVTNCKIKNRDGALKAYNAAEPQFRNFIRMVCQSEGVEIP